MKSHVYVLTEQNYRGKKTSEFCSVYIKMHIILDTETTGPNINKQHRLIRIACLRINDTYEIIDTFHTFLNPQRKVDIFAYKVHGKNYLIYIMNLYSVKL